MSKKNSKPMRHPNGFGSVVKLSGRRRNPFEARTAARFDSRGFPVYDVIGRYPDRLEALAALIEYNKNPYDIKGQRLTFSELYNLWFDSKYNGLRQYSASSIGCTRAAYKHCSPLYQIPIGNIKALHLQEILDAPGLSHAMAEHIRNLFNHMFAYAVENDFIVKNYASFVKLNMPDDDEHGVAFTCDEIKQLWAAYASGVENVDMVLMLIYSGWRITEFLNISIDLDNMTMTGGIKTAAGKNRIVPISSKIYNMISARHSSGWFNCTLAAYTKLFKEAVTAAGVTTYHTPHDCRHTFITLLDNAGANQTTIKRLAGHALQDVTSKIYTHKDIEELKKAIDLI